MFARPFSRFPIATTSASLRSFRWAARVVWAGNAQGRDAARTCPSHDGPFRLLDFQQKASLLFTQNQYPRALTEQRIICLLSLVVDFGLVSFFAGEKRTRERQ